MTARDESGWDLFRREVETWNRQLNLIGAADQDVFDDVLFADAEVMLTDSFVPTDTRTVIDVGAGAGAPLLPLLLRVPELLGVAIEPIGKRCTFMRQAGAKLGIASRLKVLQSRLEDCETEVTQLEGPRLFWSRATFDKDSWLDVIKPHLNLTDRVLVLSRQTLPVAEGYVLEQEKAYALPSSGAPRIMGRYRLRGET